MPRILQPFRFLMPFRFTAAAVTAAIAMSATHADARPRQHDERQRGYGTVTGQSRYGNPSLTVPVRRGRFGPEIDLGRGTWVHCEAGDCRETLRRQKIDYWETIREEGGYGRD